MENSKTVEIFQWLQSKNYQKEQGEQEYFMYFDLSMPKILTEYSNEQNLLLVEKIKDFQNTFKGWGVITEEKFRDMFESHFKEEINGN